MTDTGTRLCDVLPAVAGGGHRRTWLRLVAAAFIVLSALPARAASVSFATTGSTTWTVPAGVTSVTVEAWGGGGAGGGATANPAKGGGGAGGQYAKKALTVVPGTAYAVVVGKGGSVSTGTGGAGGDSSFAGTSVVAKGGAAGTGAASGVAGAGSATGGIGDVVYAGGSGSAGVITSSSCSNGGAGGGGAGSGGAGGSASGNTAGTGTASGGGSGGAGTNSSSAGSAGSAAGGGGGGACAESSADRSGGAGGVGLVKVSYSSTLTTLAATSLGTSAARVNGKINSNGLSSTVSFEYGLTTSYGSTATSTPTTVAASVVGETAFYADLSSLACNKTYHFRAKATNSDGTIYGDDMTFTTLECPAFCTPPSNIPSDVAVSCVCDTFGRTSVNPSTIFSGNWALSNSDGISDPYINQSTGLLRLTENTQKNAKAATAPAIFPAAGNYISVEFKQYAYGGNGADGVAVTLSDYSIPAVPGAFGGSLGYAQKTYGQSDCTTSGGCPGFAGGWLGVALDEYGNYSNPTEGRVLGSGFKAESVGVRGPGSAQNGYRWMGGSLGVGSVDNPSSSSAAPGYMYQVVVDSRNYASGTVNINVNRDTTSKDGSSYSSLFGPFNAYTEAKNAVTQGWISKIVPDYWKISFTGSTGSNTNIHEIGSLRICAQSLYASTGGIASGFSAVDEAYSTTTTPPVYQYFQTGHIYTKLAGDSFNLWVAALTTTPASGLASTYALSSNKYVQVKLVDNSDNVCGSDAARTCNSTCTGKAAVETGGSQVVTFAKGNTSGAVKSSSFTLNSAHANLIAVMKECSDSSCGTFTSTAAACSADTFSVRPKSFSALTSTGASNSATSGTPILKADSDTFDLTATTISGYTGVPKINTAAVSAVSPATVAGSLSGDFAAATSGISSSTATASGFKYSEVGAFQLLAPDFSLTTPRVPGVYDDTWTAVDSGTSGDCVSGSTAAAYSNSKNSDGKYGCNFGIVANSAGFGRFVPYEFRVSGVTLTNHQATPAFSYLDEPMGLGFTLKALSGSGSVTQNYSGVLAKLDLSAVANLAFGAAVPPTPFTALTSRLSAAGFAGPWPAFDASGAGTVALTGTVSVSSLNTPSANRIKPDGPFVGAAIGIAPQDSDGVRILNYDLDTDNSGGTSGADHYQLATTTLYFGQLRLLPAIGSELLPLAMRAEVQRYNGSAFVANGDDSSTSVPLANLLLSTWTANLTAGKTSITSGALSVAKGVATIKLSAPGKGYNGSVRVTADLSSAGLSYLAGHWLGAAKYDQNPSAIASFGLYKGAGQIIYFGENY